MAPKQLTTTAMAVLLAVVGTLMLTSISPIRAANSSNQPPRLSKVKTFIAAHNGHFTLRTGGNYDLYVGAKISNVDSEGWADYTYTISGGGPYHTVETGVINLTNGTRYYTSSMTNSRPAP
ncbi:MAG TPA: hypothetical protein VGK19_00760 [Capsulimonadaceae bacterium]|jgi:hypothetical protein